MYCWIQISFLSAAGCALACAGVAVDGGVPSAGLCAFTSAGVGGGRRALAGAGVAVDGRACGIEVGVGLHGDAANIRLEDRIARRDRVV